MRGQGQFRENIQLVHAQICRQLKQSLFLQADTALTQPVYTDLSTEFVDNVLQTIPSHRLMMHQPLPPSR